MRKSQWTEFIIDCGDTLGGVGVGIGVESGNKMIVLGCLAFVLVVTYFKYKRVKSKE